MQTTLDEESYKTHETLLVVFNDRNNLPLVEGQGIVIFYDTITVSSFVC